MRAVCLAASLALCAGPVFAQPTPVSVVAPVLTEHRAAAESPDRDVARPKVIPEDGMGCDSRARTKFNVMGEFDAGCA
jgi:hypothetical protein